ncbi:MAG: heat-inducible transcriptional repressor HrcA [Dehalococcoidia bacterium]
MTVTVRRAGILGLVVREYVETAAPVGSKTIREKYGLPASAATIRHEMQALEEEGLLTQPHTSAGRVPSDQGYRFFVESLMGQVELSGAEKATIRHQFYQAAPELDHWVDLAAALLARSLGLLAIVAPPRAQELRVRHLELIGLKDLLALLVVVLREARVLKQLVTLDAVLDQAQLSLLAQRLNEQVSGKTVTELRRLPSDGDVNEEAVLGTLRQVLQEEEARDADARIEGLPGVLAQPEFQADHERVMKIMSLVDRRAAERFMPTAALGPGSVSVVIGEENPDAALHDCSVVMAPYGFRSDLSGYVGVIGPTRMQYGRGVASVRYLSGLMQEMLEHVYG